jgi:4-amino-4-deoxy-L-arabinose transferase-like glycosyltransferase
MPEWLWWGLGYLLFIWITLSFIEIWSVTPDMLMASFVFLAAGLIAKIRAGDANFRNFLYLGTVLGLGYLSKTFMFAVALIFLTMSILVIRRKTKILPSVLCATGIFLLISLPFILLISEKKGQFTIGEAGTVTYLRYVNGMPFTHWQGDPLASVVPAHPSRIVHQSPPIYEFGEPVGGTYPIATDPSFWYEGIEPDFDLEGLFARLFAGGFVYAELFLQRQGILLACVLALYMMGQRHRYPLNETLRRWALVLPAVFAFGLYATVLVEDRYVGVFVLLFWADVLGNVRLPDTENNRLWLGSLSMIVAFGLMANIVLFNLEGFSRLNPSLVTVRMERSTPSASPLSVAQTLRDLDVMPGERVGVIGYGYDSFWARLARVKIVAEMLEKDAIDLWHADEEQWQSVLEAFENANVRAVIAEYVPDDVRLNNWHRVANSNYYIYLFEE